MITTINDQMPPPQINTLSLHDALPIYQDIGLVAAVGPSEEAAHDVGDGIFETDGGGEPVRPEVEPDRSAAEAQADRKSRRLNSSHVSIWYAVFCLKKKRGSRRGGRGTR